MEFPEGVRSIVMPFATSSERELFKFGVDVDVAVVVVIIGDGADHCVCRGGEFRMG